MITFASFPATSEASGSYGATRHHPDVEDDVHMDLDEDDFEEGVQRLTVPGESITSSHAFMRYVPSTREPQAGGLSERAEVTEPMLKMRRSSHR